MKSFFNEKLTKCVLTIIVILIGYFLLLPANTFAEVTAPINFRVDRYAESEDPSTKYATLQWDAISDVVSYNLYTVGSSDIFFDSSPTNAYTLKFNKNSIFYFKVTAVDKNGREGSKSQTVSVEFPSAGVSLTSPKNLRISQTETTANKSVKKVHIFWDPVPGATSYIVYKNAGTTYYYHITVDTNLYEMDIPVSSTFYIAVSAKKNNLESARSQVLTIDLSKEAEGQKMASPSVVSDLKEDIKNTNLETTMSPEAKTSDENIEKLKKLEQDVKNLQGEVQTQSKNQNQLQRLVENITNFLKRIFGFGG